MVKATKYDGEGGDSLCQSILAQLASDTALLVPTERNLVVQFIVLVHLWISRVISTRCSLGDGWTYPDGTSTEVVSSLDSSRDIPREDSCGKTVHAIVGHLDDI